MAQSLCVGNCFQPLSHKKHPSKLRLISSLLIRLSFPLSLSPYSYISWCSYVNDYSPLLFLVNYNYVWFSFLYHIVTLNIDIPQNLSFHFFIFYYSYMYVHTAFPYALTYSSHKNPDEHLVHFNVVSYILF